VLLVRRRLLLLEALPSGPLLVVAAGVLLLLLLVVVLAGAMWVKTGSGSWQPSSRRAAALACSSRCHLHATGAQQR
jgi:hypothetical protein